MSETGKGAPCVLHAPCAGDLGWIVHRHGVLYSQEYGWNEKFEGLVAEVAAAYLRDHDPHLEHCWIAERNGAIAGSVMLVRAEGGFAKLRLLYVEPAARGFGIGRMLLAQCIDKARECRYAGVVLWTTSNLHSARRLYEAAGFRLESEEPFDTFGMPLVGQYWRLAFDAV